MSISARSSFCSRSPFEDLARPHQQVARLAVVRVGRRVGERDERRLELPGVEERLAFGVGLLSRRSVGQGQDALLGQPPPLERPGVLGGEVERLVEGHLGLVRAALLEQPLAVREALLEALGARRRVQGLGLCRALALLLARDGAQRVGIEAARERLRLRQQRQGLVPGAAAPELLRAIEQPPHLAARAPRQARGLGRLRLAAVPHQLGEEWRLADGPLLLGEVEGVGGGDVLLLLEQAHAQVVVRQVVHELQAVRLHVGRRRASSRSASRRFLTQSGKRRSGMSRSRACR